MPTFIEPSDINLEVISRDLSSEESERISQHIAAYKTRKHRAALVAQLMEKIEELDFNYIQNPDNQLLIKREECVAKLKELFIPLHIDLVKAA